MVEMAVTVMLYLMATYLIAGVLFTFPFQWKGMNKIDEGVHGSTIGFRIIIVPGCILLWPVLWRRWVKRLGEDKAINQTQLH